MSLWRDFFEGVTEGVITVVSQRRFSSNGQSYVRIDRLCRDLGWPVDERNGNVMHLHFGNSPVRKVCIVEGDDLITFSAHAFPAIPPQNVSGEIMAYLLRRNLGESGMGNW